MNSIRNKLTLKTAAILLFVFTGSLYGSDGDANSISFFLLVTGLLG